jgi:two-component system, LytTR family, sensor kinase
MPDIKRYSHLRIFAHLIFWVASIGFMLFFFYYNEKKVHLDLVVLSKALITNMGFAFGVYVNLWILIPKFLKQKNYVFYVFWLVVLITLSSIFIQLLLMFPLRILLEPGIRLRSFNINLHAAYFSATLIYVAFTSFLKFIKDWISIQDLNLKLAKIEQQKLEAELVTLKGQLNPHFLFNSLNNIYSLALIQSEKVPDLILRLADLMRHIIYESRENFISLEKEIDFVTNFISLQKIRTAENVKIEYNVQGVIPEARIVPLIFEPFIDNAFKHGLPGINGKDYILISFDFSTPGWLNFKIENNYELSEDYKHKKNGGIGIANVKQRLEHLYKTSEYQLKIEHLEYIHSVNLKLKLK